MTIRPKVSRPRISWSTNAALVRLLVDGPHTVQDLMDETGLCEGTVRGYCNSLHRAKLIHICAWLPNRRGETTVRQWRWGPDTTDARRRKKTDSERSAAYRARQRQAKLYASVHGLQDVLAVRDAMSQAPLSPPIHRAKTQP